MVLGYELVESRGGLAGQGDKQHRQPVRSEFAGYLDCSVLQRGFAHLACEDCGVPRLVAFTCAGRGFPRVLAVA